MKVLISGSNGFLGSAFVKFLKKKNIPHLVYDRNNPEKLSFDFDSVVNFGGLTPNSDIKNGVFTPEEYRIANVEGTKLFLENIVKNKKLKRFINIGTAAECGFSVLPISEGFEEKPIGPYGESKLVQSKLVRKFAEENKIKVINLRLFNVAGLPNRIRSRGVVASNPFIFESLVDQFVLNFNGQIFINNENDIRDYVDIEDIMEAIFLALKTENGGQYEIINICSGMGTKLADVVSLFGKVLNKEYKIRAVSGGDKNCSQSVGVSDKAKKILNWEPNTNLEESIKKMTW